MTQQPPPQSPQLPQSPQPAEGAPDQTAALWYDQTQPQPPFSSQPPVDPQPWADPQPPVDPQSSVDPQTPAEPRPAVLTQPGVEPAAPAKPRRLAELVTVALLAAALASTGTYAVTRADDAAAPSAPARSSATTSAAPVVQADASAPNWSVTAAAVSPSVVAISVTSGQSGGQGSGVIFDTQGHILTNNHVVTAGGQNSQITVTLNDKRTYDATVVGTDPTTDLAVVKLTNAPSDLKAIALGDANALTVGDRKSVV